MDIKSQLIKILEKENYTFAQLADFLNMPEEELSNELNNKTLDLRNLELISKALRVPLYSFFRGDNQNLLNLEKPYYINKLWTGDDANKSKEQLEEEIILLKQIILLKEEQLNTLG
jgi:transcriptional regulator with XRE-family HTH domain